MKVGDLVIQRGWEADGVGLVIEVGVGFAVVLWPGGEADMLLGDLEVINESR